MVTAEVLERRERALDMAVAGASLRSIGRVLEVSHETIRQDLNEQLREMSRINLSSRGPLRALMLSRYERLLQGCMPRALGGADAEGNPTRPDLEYMDRALRILADMTRLMGLARDARQTAADLAEEA